MHYSPCYWHLLLWLDCVQVATPPTDWVVTPEVKAKYDSYFQGIDKDHDGLVTGEEARGLFMASNLQQNTLAHIWWGPLLRTCMCLVPLRSPA